MIVNFLELKLLTYLIFLRTFVINLSVLYVCFLIQTLDISNALVPSFITDQNFY